MHLKRLKDSSFFLKTNETIKSIFYLSDDEQYILNTKFKATGMKSIRDVSIQMLF